jgi:Uma2 family endonuclease
MAMCTIIPVDEGDVDEPRPQLFPGQRLSRAEFHRIYGVYHGHVKYELVDGTVYVEATRRRPHARFHALASALLCFYEIATPGVEALSNATTILDERNEVQPDLQLRILTEYGGRTTVTADQFLAGPPELIIEIADPNVVLDLRIKRFMYRAQGVKEYVVVDAEAAKLCWFMPSGEERQIDSDGVLKSVTFPGLWIDSQALFQEQIAHLQSTLNQGLQHPEHAAFVAKLQNNAQ